MNSKHWFCGKEQINPFTLEYLPGEQMLIFEIYSYLPLWPDWMYMFMTRHFSCHLQKIFHHLPFLLVLYTRWFQNLIKPIYKFVLLSPKKTKMTKNSKRAANYKQVHFFFQIDNFIEIIVDSHSVIRNISIEKIYIVYPVSTNGNILQNYSRIAQLSRYFL